MSPRLTLGLLLCIAVGGALLAVWMVRKTDQEMRADLIREGRLVAQAVRTEDVRALTGTAADLSSPVYQKLKAQLIALRLACPHYRFAYLLGRKPDGTLFFFIDSEPVDSHDYSPPGEVYDEAITVALHVFATRTAADEGPTTDRWGSWVSALVPLLDPHTALYGLATPQEAQAMVRQAVEFYRKYGRARFLQEVNNPLGAFRKGDLYAFVYDRNMTWLAHPVKPELVGQNWIDKKDWSGGKLFRREIQAVAQKGKGWVEFEYLNPLNGQHDHKTTYIEGLDDLVICSGAYKGDGEICAVLGLDVDARDWSKRLLLAALPRVLLTVVLAGVLLIGSVLLARRPRDTKSAAAWMVLIEPVFVAAAGIVLTLLVAWLLHRRETHDRNAAFEQLAISRTEAVASTLEEIRGNGIEGLAHFYENSGDAGVKSFHRFTEYLTKNPAVLAWGWVPVVPLAEKARFEIDARAAGVTGFQIWEKDERGKPRPAMERPVYYPVFQLAPVLGSQRPVGFDLGSERRRLAALDAAVRTGLVSATESITLMQETGQERGMLVLRPVFDGGEARHLRGFALAVLRLGALLKRAAPDSSAIMELTLLRQGQEPDLLATTRDPAVPPDDSLSLTRPVFAFGKVFFVTARAGAEFMRLHSVRAGWLALFPGLGLTAALTLAVNLVLRRRQHLEQLVRLRTRELQESEQAYRDQFARNSAVMLMIDPHDGAIVDANATAATFYGYAREQLLTLQITDLNPQPMAEILQVFAAVRQEEGRRFEFQQRLANGSLREVEVSASRIQFGARVVLHAIIYDITERKRAEQERAVMTRQLEGINILGELLLQPASFETKLAAITNGIVLYFQADFCRIWLIRSGDFCHTGCLHAQATAPQVCPCHDRCLHLLACSGRYTRIDDKGRGRVPLGCYKIGRLASGSDPKCLSNDLASETDGSDRECLQDVGHRAYAGYQLRVPGGEAIGVLDLFSTQPITTSADAMLDGLSCAVALTVQQALAEAAMQKANDELEVRVEQRTLELTRTNELMRGEIAERRRAEEAHLQALAERDAAIAQLRNLQKP